MKRSLWQNFLSADWRSVFFKYSAWTVGGFSGCRWTRSIFVKSLRLGVETKLPVSSQTSARQANWAFRRLRCHSSEIFSSFRNYRDSLDTKTTINSTTLVANQSMRQTSWVFKILEHDLVMHRVDNWISEYFSEQLINGPKNRRFFIGSIVAVRAAERHFKSWRLFYLL